MSFELDLNVRIRRICVQLRMSWDWTEEEVNLLAEEGLTAEAVASWERFLTQHERERLTR